MTITILPAVGEPDAARAVGGLLGQLPDVEPLAPVGDSTRLLDTLASLAAASVEELPQVVLVHERIGPVPALELIREVALRFPAVGVVLMTADAGPALYSAAMDSGARGLAALPLTYDELAARVHAAAQWARGVRRHLGGGGDPLAAARPGGRLVAVVGAKGGVGTTVTAVQLALAARSAGRSVALVDMDLQSGDIASYLDVQFRRSIADLAQIADITPRVLQEAVFTHQTGLGLLLAPGEGERGEEVGETAARQIIGALRARFEVVVVDCGTQITTAGAATIEIADTALLVTTPDVVAVRATKRMVRLWDRLQIRKAEETLTLVNRHTRGAEIQPALVERATGTRCARTCVPAGYKELQPAVDSGRMHDLDAKSTVRQALWGLAGELGLVDPAAATGGGRGHRGGHAGPADRSLPGLRRRRALGAGPGAGGAPAPDPRAGTGPEALTQVPGNGRFGRRRGGDRGQVTVEFIGVLPVILVVLIAIWQCVLVGYTYSLAGNAADAGARAAAVGEDCAAAATEDLPDAWTADVSCGAVDGDVRRVTVDLKVPLLFPGAVDFPWHVTGSAGAVEEAGR
ncbi:AAA family ATPase [Streptomyces sp. SAJ15]|uniref:AAA family ATPase n=1 Tax=Streptomyces sp. SAJ15 TaxID=2011095 RepID=UPI001186D2C2|nr:TadE/TadG family type IV pilus assembly protein [Streptomyces sp. SAJ15]TVL93894.1 septum formation initiator [Streptomyces sp. SAJ15]